jgi:small-conductance mechanosensitive channel
MPEPEQNVVDLPSEGQHVSVEIDKDSVSPAIQEGTVEEHEEYSAKVQKRIDKLTKKAREAERQQKAAIEYAKNVQQENTALKGRVHNLDVGYVSEYGDRINSQTESITRDMQDAVASGDTTKQVELNKKLAQLAIEEERVRAAKAEQKRMEQAPAPAAQQTAQPQPQAPVRPDPKAEEWATENKWFGENDAMTFAAFGIHKTLVEEEGFDTNSPEYYAEIDKRVREAFPHKFNQETMVEETVSVSEGRRPQQAVASAVRSSNSGRKTVKLSPSEVAIANKLGVPLNEYAKYKR